MTINGINSSSTLASLLLQVQQTTQQSATPSPSSPLNASPAYTLSLGQQQADTSLLVYGSLGKLVNQADTALANMDRNNPSVTATQGDGSTLQQSYLVNVMQLAQAQTLTSQSYSSPSQSVIPTGTLTIQNGSYSSANGDFSVSGNPLNISITDGSLNGVVSAINSARSGVAASVIQTADGSYQLQLTGPTGAANAFQLSGIDALGFTPATPSTTGLAATQNAADAQYTVNGGNVQTSSTNSGVAIDQGVTADFTATGAMTVNAPFGLSQTNGAAQIFVKNLNNLLTNLSQMTGSNGPLPNDTGVAGSLEKAIKQSLTQTLAGGKSLATIGINTQADGTLALDQSALQKAYTNDPTGTRALLDQASAAAQSVLSGSGGAVVQIKSEMQALMASLNQTTSLFSSLYGSDANQNASQSLDGLLSGSDQTSQLLATLGGNATSNSNNTSTEALLSALTGTSASNNGNTSTDALLSALAGGSTSTDSSSSNSSLLATLLLGAQA